MRWTWVLMGMQGIVSCRPKSLDELCVRAIPEFNREVEGAKSALAAWVRTGEPQRAIASEDLLKASDIEVHEDDKKSWKLWAEKKLKQAQVHLDLADENPRFRPVNRKISDVANLLVEFDGYVSQGDLNGMIKTLQNMENKNLEISHALCGS